MVLEKKFKIGFVFFIIIAVSAGGFLWYKKHHAAAPKEFGKLLPDINRHLTDDQRKIYTDRIGQANDYLKNLDFSQSGNRQGEINTYIYLGQQYYGLGQMEKSKSAYQQALALDHGNSDAISGLAQTLSEGGDGGSAAQALQAGLKNEPDNPSMWLLYIRIRQSLGASNAELIDYYGQALLNTDSNIDILTSGAEFEEKIGQTDQAIVLWQKAAKVNPDNGAAYQAEVVRLQENK